MRKNIVCLILGTALLGATLAGCGNEDATSATSASSTTSTTPQHLRLLQPHSLKENPGHRLPKRRERRFREKAFKPMAAKLFLLPLWNIRMQLRILLFILHLISVRRPWWRLMMLWVRD